MELGKSFGGKDTYARTTVPSLTTIKVIDISGATLADVNLKLANALLSIETDNPQNRIVDWSVVEVLGAGKYQLAVRYIQDTRYVL